MMAVFETILKTFFFYFICFHQVSQVLNCSSTAIAESHAHELASRKDRLATPQARYQAHLSQPMSPAIKLKRLTRGYLPPNSSETPKQISKTFK